MIRERERESSPSSRSFRSRFFHFGICFDHGHVYHPLSDHVGNEKGNGKYQFADPGTGNEETHEPDERWNANDDEAQELNGQIGPVSRARHFGYAEPVERLPANEMIVDAILNGEGHAENERNR